MKPLAQSLLLAGLALPLLPLMAPALRPLPVPAGQQASSPEAKQPVPPPPPSHLPPTEEKPIEVYKKHVATAFRTSDRCVACHNGMKTASGDEVSIGLDWQASIMANSSRDPYWQGSIRRESLDHPEAKTHIQNDCSFCHMAAVRLEDRDAGKDTQVFARLPFKTLSKNSPQLVRAAQDGVTCSVCHQVEKDGLGTDQTFNGNVVIAKSVQQDLRPEYGPFNIDHGHETIMHSSTAGYLPHDGAHMRDSALCGSCHTLYTDPIAPPGVKLARFPEQMPYQEWQHSSFGQNPTPDHNQNSLQNSIQSVGPTSVRNPVQPDPHNDAPQGTPSPVHYQTCQQCHMPEITEPAQISVLYGQLRDGLHRHVFVGANFVVQSMLNQHRDDLTTVATPEDLNAAVTRTREFLQTQAAQVTLEKIAQPGTGSLSIDVLVRNLSGHKLPTAYPSRRAWLHLTVRDARGQVVFESGALRPDGSIVGNVNDEDPSRFEPHFREITRPDQVEIYEDILGDIHGKVTTGLLSTVRYLKDNRLLPAGFDKATAEKDISVVGEAATDPAFTGGSSRVRYVVPTSGATGPFHVEAELWYQPIGFRWAHNLAPYQAPEPQRMVRYFEQSASASAIVLAHADASTDSGSTSHLSASALQQHQLRSPRQLRPLSLPH